MMPPPQRAGGPPPFRAKPQMHGRMMADGGGGLGAPAPIGGGAPPPSMGKGPAPAPGAGVDPDMDQDVDSPAVQPDAVHYHDDAQSCQGCQHMDQSGQCNILKMQVSPEGGCAAYEAKGGDQGGDDGQWGGGDTDMDMGQGGGQQ